VERLRVSAAPILQCGAAAGVAWFVANDLVGHQRPFFAPIAAVISLGVSLGSRLRRTVELVLGVSLGVLVGDLLIAGIGSGPWQVAAVVVLAMSAAVLANGATLLVGQAGSSAVLVATLLPPGQAGGFDRCLDALIGGAVGLAVAAVLPTDPVGPVRREARLLLGELAGVLDGSAKALRTRNADEALSALRRARATQPLVDQLRAAIRGGREVTAVSPLLRRRRRELARFAEVAERTDYAIRNTRVLARRAYTLLGDDDACPDELPDALGELAAAVEGMAAELGRDGDLAKVRMRLLDAARHSLDGQSDGDLGTSELVVVAQLRSIVLDLLQATGLSRADALAALRRDP
jgi:uncharacterized membrane protein YgaE (UPF0421/DUF939 family)